MVSEDVQSNEPAVAWRLLLGAVGLLMIVVALAVQWSQETAIPPLIVLPVLFVVALVLLALRPRVGAIATGVLAVVMVLGNLPFIVEDLTHPESFWSFVPTGLAIIGGVIGLIALVAVLRRAGPGLAGVLTAFGIAGVIGVIVVGGLSTSGQEDDIRQDDDFGMFAQDIEFSPKAFEAPAGDIGIYIGNDDLVRHNFSIDELGIDEELPSKAFVRIAIEGAEPGTYEYYCNVQGHEDMKGTLTVS